MKGVVYSTAVGCGCLLGAGAFPSQAAEWSVQPSLSWSVDHDSNRLLLVNPQGSEEGVLSGDLRLKRSLEQTEITLEPRWAVRRFTDPVYGDGDDKSLLADFSHASERMQLDVNASILDQSTLTTELLETGIVQGDTHRRTLQGAGTWSWSQTERRQSFAQLGFADVTYHGQGTSFLPGYRYPSGALGERFLFSERSTFSVSAFGDALSTSSSGNSSHEAGIQLDLTRALSERTHIDAAVGESERSLAGSRGFGTNGLLSLTHDWVLGSMGLGYTRSLVPYGIGFLVQRQQLTASATRRLTPYLTADLALIQVQNSQSAVALHLDRPRYDNATTGVNWRASETWTIRTELGTSRTQTIGVSHTVREWRAALTTTWTPLPSARSR